MGIISAPTRVYVKQQMSAPIINGDNLLCEGEKLILEVIDGMPESNDEHTKVIWYKEPFHQPIDTTNDNRFQILQVDEADVGTYYAILLENGCESLPSNPINVTIASRTELAVNAGQDTMLCTAGEISLAALEVAKMSDEEVIDKAMYGLAMAYPSDVDTEHEPIV